MNRNQLIDKELLELVKSDIIYLKNEWKDEIDDASLRRSSNILRNLITQDYLGQVSRSLGFKYKITTSSLSQIEIFNLVPLKRIQFYVAGGGTYHGLKVQSAMQIQGILNESERKLIMELTHPEKTSKTIKLDKFKEMPSFIVNGYLINKNELIQYVANKKGGTHYDPIRKLNSKESLYSKLDDIFNSWVVADKNSVYFELLSIGQELSGSQSTSDLLKYIEIAL